MTVPVSGRPIRIISVVGARPNFMKIGPIARARANKPAFAPHLLHTGQHYDAKMSDLFFEQLGLPRPDIHLGVGGGGHGEQTGRVMVEFEKAILAMGDEPPDVVLVVGDVNSTIACGLVAVKLGIKLVHVEAGLRSRDRAMPEEINRILTDQISDLLFTTERTALDNLVAEGIEASRVHFVGNVMIDTLLQHRAAAAGRTTLSDLGLERRGYGVVTLHRPANVDDPEVFRTLLEPLCEISTQMPLVFPMHPRSAQRLESFGFKPMLDAHPNLRILEPLGYLDFLALTDGAAMAITDSGGIQEETTVLGVPCITARDNTERPATITEGTNTIVGRDPAKILAAAREVMAGQHKGGGVPELWDGQAGERIVAVIERELSAA